MSLRLVVILIAVLTLLISACSGDDSASSTPTSAPTTTPTVAATNGGIVPPSASPVPTGTFLYATASTIDERVVALLGSGYTVDGGQVSGAVVLHNRNRSEAVIAQYTVTPIINGTDGTPTTYTVVLLPNQELGDAFSLTYPDGATVATVKISVLPPNRWVTFASADRLDATLTTPIHPQGTVRNPFANDTGPLRLTVISRDEGGRIIDGKSISLDSIAPGAVGAFNVKEANSLTAFTAYVSFENDLPAWAH